MTEKERVDINSTIKILSDYFEPKLNTTYERYVFNSCDQEIGERFDAYLNKLRKLKRADTAHWKMNYSTTG